MSMIQQQIEEYIALDQQRRELPVLIAQAQNELTNTKILLTAERKQLERIGEAVVDNAIVRAGGIKEFGSSEDIRKKRAREVKGQDRNYVEQERMTEACEVDMLRAEDMLSDLIRQYGAVCFGITHHAALMQMLGNAGAQAIEYSFEISPSPSTLFGTAEVTPEEMAEAGF